MGEGAAFRTESLRIGQGVDVHQFAEGRRLFLGGVEIESRLGLKGHSDADVLLHAIIDAVLGAAGEGDIGQWFPDTDEHYRGISSAELFNRVWRKLSDSGWGLVNCDCTVLAQMPKIAPVREKIRDSIAGLFGASSTAVSVKGTTTERLGFVGREEGIMALAVVLLSRSI